MRMAFDSIASKTGFSSPGDALMTLSTSAVAVCCCSRSLRSSLSTRVFSMAMTACAAKVFSTPICLSESAPGAARTTLSAPMASRPRIIGMMVIAR